MAVEATWRLCGRAALLTAALGMVAGRPLSAEIKLDYLHEQDPRIVLPDPITKTHARLIDVWREALRDPGQDLPRQAAQALGEAHLLRIPKTRDAIPELLGLLDRQDQRFVRIAATRTLVMMEARETAPRLLELVRSRDDLDLSQIVEPALAQWKYEPAAELWRTRLKSPAASRRLTGLACRGLAALEDASSRNALAAMAESPQLPIETRLEAARAAGKVVADGLVEPATRLARQTGRQQPLASVLAVALLSRHTDADAVELLKSLAQTGEPAVDSGALGRLFEIDPDLALPFVPSAIQNADAGMRMVAVRTVLARPTPERLADLTAVLDDKDPSIRAAVREGLFAHAANPEFKPAILSGAMTVLKSQSWRGLEQAGLLLAELDHEPAAPRFVELVDFPRDEVAQTAAWGLRKLAVRDVLPGIRFHLGIRTAQRSESMQAGGGAGGHIDRLCAHLAEALEVLGDRDSIPLLRQYVPKNPTMGDYSRGAAIWALGKLLEDRPDERLAAELAGRLTDQSTLPPEVIRVKLMSAIAIGRMGARSQLPTLRSQWEPDQGSGFIGAHCAWAIERMTGEKLPPPQPATQELAGWFLVPIDPRPKAPPEP